MKRPPSPLQRSKELLIGRDIARFATGSRVLRSAPRGDGGPVVLVTGFGGTDTSLYPLRGFLRRLGYDARSAGLGRMTDDVESLFPRIVERCQSIVDQTGRVPAVVGWSIGGVVAREAARERPDLVRRVITFGTPVEGGPSYTALSFLYSEARLAEIRRLVDERHQVPIEVALTAMWSRNDGIVLPEACIDVRTPGVENIEITSTHLGMGVDPQVWSIVADRLARPGQ